MDQLQALRVGDWKLFLPLENKKQNWGNGLGKTFTRLYNLNVDINEMVDLSGKHPEIVQELSAYADYAREELGDLGVPGKGIRKAGFVKEPKPLLINKPD